MDFFDSIILGVIQGLTEFLPISSSGHLVLAKSLIGIEDSPLLYDLFFHFATVLAITTHFRKELRTITISFVRYTLQRYDHQDERLSDEIKENVRFVVYILIGTVPAAVVGVMFEGSIRNFFTSPGIVGIFLMVTGLILLSTHWCPKSNKRISGLSAVLIGIAQSLALFPGVSRSGATISAGLWLGIKPETAVRYSFFLAIPIILGANLVEFTSVPVSVIKREFWQLMAGGLFAYGSGMIAIVLVLRIIRTGKFYAFGLYCLTAGAFSYFTLQ